MPDHLHGLINFPPDKRMSDVVGQWKNYNNRHNGILWQDNYFDHRLRSDASLDEKASYIRQNPVVKGLCEKPNDWPWMLDLNNVHEWS
jgi:REP element-mobilizing transposase RayT